MDDLYIVLYFLYNVKSNQAQRLQKLHSISTRGYVFVRVLDRHKFKDALIKWHFIAGCNKVTLYCGLQYKKSDIEVESWTMHKELSRIQRDGRWGTTRASGTNNGMFKSRSENVPLWSSMRLDNWIQFLASQERLERLARAYAWSWKRPKNLDFRWCCC